MGKPTGFMEYERKDNAAIEPLERIKNFNEFHAPMREKDRKEQAARCMNCGVPFCQSGISKISSQSQVVVLLQLVE